MIREEERGAAKVRRGSGQGGCDYVVEIASEYWCWGETRGGSGLERDTRGLTGSKDWLSKE